MKTETPWTRNQPNIGDYSVSVTLRNEKQLVIVQQHFNDNGIESCLKVTSKQADQIQRCLNFGLDNLDEYMEQCALMDKQINSLVKPAEKSKKAWLWILGALVGISVLSACLHVYGFTHLMGLLK